MSKPLVIVTGPTGSKKHKLVRAIFPESQIIQHTVFGPCNPNGDVHNHYHNASKMSEKYPDGHGIIKISNRTAFETNRIIRKFNQQRTTRAVVIITPIQSLSEVVEFATTGNIEIFPVFVYETQDQILQNLRDWKIISYGSNIQRIAERYDEELEEMRRFDAKNILDLTENKTGKLVDDINLLEQLLYSQHINL